MFSRIFRRKSIPVPAQVSPDEFAKIGRHVAVAFTEHCQNNGRPATPEQIGRVSAIIGRNLSTLLGQETQVYCGRFPYRGNDGIVRDTISLTFRPPVHFHGKPVVFRIDRQEQGVEHGLTQQDAPTRA